MSHPESKVFLALQTTADTRELIEAILEDNPHATADEQPAMVRIIAPGTLTINAASISEKLGRDYDLQEMQIYLISLSGHVDESDDTFTLSWSQ